MFELKKLLATLMMPLPGLLLVGFFGLLVIWFSRYKGFGSIFVFVSLFCIGLISFQPFSSSLLLKLERQHSSFFPTTEPVDYVMVLGSGHVVDNELPATAELSQTAMMRLVEGIRIHLMYPTSKLILSGYNGGTEVSHARMLARVALALGVNKNNILLLETAKDTKEEAAQAFPFVKNKNLVLVTSASHMTRALNEFTLLGIKVTPAPTNFMAQKEIKQPWVKYAPKAEYLEQFERYWYEFLGKSWQYIREEYSNNDESLLQTTAQTSQQQR